jgi:hypothetical protein
MSTASQAPPSANTLLAGGGRKFRSLSFKGDRPTIEYRDLEVQSEPETFQRTDDDGNPEFWDALAKERTTDRTNADGEPNKPLWKFSVKVKLPDGSPVDPDIVEEYGEDDLIRYLYFSGQIVGSKTTFDAIATACRQARTKRGLQPGGTIRRIAWVAGGEAKRGSTKSTQKEYEAEYDPSTESPARGSANAKVASAGRRDDVPPPDGPTDGGAYDDDEPPF